ncbi:class I SAM-dependent methyltransferase [Rhodovibrionaceae bacterium A322]
MHLTEQTFIQANTAVLCPPLVPEIKLHLASEDLDFWQMTQDDLDNLEIPPPFWAFAWAGGQALTRYLLDNPALVRGKRVLDFAAGCGMTAIAAARLGADAVTATEIDPYALAALELNAGLNKVCLDISSENVVGKRDGGWDLVLAGDVCYEQPMTDQVMGWLRGLAIQGALVLVGDPKRSYFPKDSLEFITAYGVKTSSELEDTDLRNAAVWRVLPADQGA